MRVPRISVTIPLPKISIVTPSFNQGAYIEEALLSAKGQNYPHVEHIVVDGGSTDGTLEILRRYAAKPGWEHLRWISEPDKGQSDALNKGFRMAAGDIVGWLNSDDRYRPGCFATIAQGFVQYPGTDVMYGDYTWIDDKGYVKRVRREIEFNKFILVYHHVLFIATVSTFFRRRVFEEGNWLDTELHYAMDSEFFMRLAEKGYRFRHLRSVLADFRWHSQNKSTTHSLEQGAEHDATALRYSRALQRMPGTLSRRLTRSVLRASAGCLRYGKKLFEGCYFPELHPDQVSTLQVVLNKHPKTLSESQ